MSSVNYKKNTQRFTFGLNRNMTAKKAGSNSFYISTNPTQDGFYSTGTTQINMTVKEAKALQGFLNQRLPVTGDSSDV